MQRRTFIQLAVATPLAVAAGCGGGTPGTDGTTVINVVGDGAEATATAGAAGADAVGAVGADGTSKVISSYYTYSHAESGTVSFYSVSSGTQVQVQETDVITSVAPLSESYDSAVEFYAVEPVDNAQRSRAGFQVGKFYCRMNGHKHPLGQCINRDVWHINLEVKDNSVKPEIIYFNLHLCVWRENGPQFGVQNNGKWPFCKTTRGKFTDIRNSIADALSKPQGNVRLPDWAVSSVSYSAALVVCAVFGIALVAIPGPP